MRVDICCAAVLMGVMGIVTDVAAANENNSSITPLIVGSQQQKNHPSTPDQQTIQQEPRKILLS